MIFASFNICATPRTPIINASVTTMACTRSFPTMKPAITPETEHTKIAVMQAIPTPKGSIFTVTIPASAMTAPTEISIPPVEITIVMPIPVRMIVQDWIMIFLIVPMLKKLGVITAFKTRNTSKRIAALYFFKTATVSAFVLTVLFICCTSNTLQFSAAFRNDLHHLVLMDIISDQFA